MFGFFLLQADSLTVERSPPMYFSVLQKMKCSMQCLGTLRVIFGFQTNGSQMPLSLLNVVFSNVMLNSGHVIDHILWTHATLH